MLDGKPALVPNYVCGGLDMSTIVIASLLFSIIFDSLHCLCSYLCYFLFSLMRSVANKSLSDNIGSVLSRFRLVRLRFIGECDFSPAQAIVAFTVVLPGLEALLTFLGGFMLKKKGCITQTNGAGCEKDDQD